MNEIEPSGDEAPEKALSLSEKIRQQMERESGLEEIEVTTPEGITKFFPEFSIDQINLKHVAPETPTPEEDQFIGEYVRRIKEVIPHYLNEFGADGITIGVSGGIDSTLSLKLCSDALREKDDNRVLRGVTFGRIPKDDFVRLPEITKEEIEQLAKTSGSSQHELVDLYWASRLHQDNPDLYNYSWEYYDISDVYNNLSEKIGHQDPFASKELLIRIQALMINQVTQEKNHVYFGTTNRSENLLGALTIGGPWGYLPLQSELYKTETYYAAKKIHVPHQFILRRAVNSALGEYDDKLYGGKTGLKGEQFFRVIDPVLYLYDQGYNVEEAAKITGHDPGFIKAVYQRVINNTERRFPRGIIVDQDVIKTENAYYGIDIVSSGELKSTFVDNRNKMMGETQPNPVVDKWQDISPVLKEGRRKTFKDINK